MFSLSKIIKFKEYQLFKNSKFVTSTYFKIFYIRNFNHNFYYGISLKKKIAKATIRNKYKRICKILINKFYHLNVLYGLNINIVPRKLIVNQKFIVIKSDFFKCLNKI